MVVRSGHALMEPAGGAARGEEAPAPELPTAQERSRISIIAPWRSSSSCCKGFRSLEPGALSGRTWL